MGHHAHESLACDQSHGSTVGYRLKKNLLGASVLWEKRAFIRRVNSDMLQISRLAVANGVLRAI